MRPVAGFPGVRPVTAALAAAVVAFLLPRAASAASYLVTSAADSGAGTLRQAIVSANTNAGPDTITFAIGSGVQRINLASGLPAVTDAVTIDGTAPGTFPTQVVAVYGTSAGGDCLALSSHTGSTVRKLVITDCRAAGASALHINGGGSHVVEGNLLGTDPTGELSLTNQIGVLIDGGSTHNTIGGTTAAQRNVISGNTLDAVILDGTGTTANTILGNYIGLDAGGAQAVRNAQNGITVRSPATGNTIGGTTAGAGNVISGQDGSCIELDSTGNLVQGNFLGTDAAGLNGLTLAGSGVYVLGDGNTIGGTATGAGNLISGNTTGLAIYVLRSNTTVQGNRIGTSADGMSAIANGDGVVMIGNDNVVGGTVAGAGNLISGNGNWAIELQGEGNSAQGNTIGTALGGVTPLSNFGGIWVQGNGNIIGGTSAAARNIIDDSEQQGIYLQGSGNVVQGNYIGVGSDGTTPMGNQGNGIEVVGGAFPDAGGTMGQNVIGGTAAGEGNVIANNGGGGVVVDQTGATIEGNSIYGNGHLGVDLGGDGVTMNHPCGSTGPNDLQSFPVTVKATGSPTGLDVSGTLSSCPNSTFHVEVFVTPTADPSGFGQGQALLGTADVTTDASGAASWNVTNSSVPWAGAQISATATNAKGETSEFGPDLRFGLASDGGAGDSGVDAAQGDGGGPSEGGGPADGGGGRDGASDSGTPAPDGGMDGASPGMDAAAADSGGGELDGAADSGGSSGGGGGSGSSGGCGCRVEGAPLSGELGWLFAVTGLLAVVLARRGTPVTSPRPSASRPAPGPRCASSSRSSSPSSRRTPPSASRIRSSPCRRG
jgi:hypothetical protein